MLHSSFFSPKLLEYEYGSLRFTMIRRNFLRVRNGDLFLNFRTDAPYLFNPFLGQALQQWDIDFSCSK